MLESRLRGRAAAFILFTSGAALAACSGGAVDGADDGEPPMPVQPRGGAGPGGAGPGGAGGAGGSPVVMPSAMCKGAAPSMPGVVTRRLTRFEYNNTIRDLLGLGDTKPAQDFPAEEKTHGFDNDAESLTVSPLLSEQYMITAERLAGLWLDANFTRVAMTYACAEVASPAGQDACARRVFQGLGKRAQRRPPSVEELQILMDVYAAGKLSAGAAGGFRNGLRLGIMTMLQSPRFLYRIEDAPANAGEATVRKLDSYEIASRLSYLVWGSQPDTLLMTAADQNKLQTPADIRAQLDRMLAVTMGDTRNPANSKSVAVVNRYFEQWLDLERIDNTDKDVKLFAKWNRVIATSMGDETARFLETLFWDPATGDLGSMLTAPFTVVNRTLATYYGMTTYVSPVDKDGKPNNDFARTATDGSRRAGLLTQGTFLAALAGPNQTSPVRRGQFVREHLLCQTLPPPPMDVAVELPALDPKLTTRERFGKHASEPACSGCHTLMDPVGLGFEKYDSIGLWRDNENGRPVDDSGEVVGMSWDGKFKGVVDLGKKLGAAPEVRECVVRSWFRFGYGRGEDDKLDACTLDHIRTRFAASGFKLRELLVALTETDAFLYKRIGESR